MTFPSLDPGQWIVGAALVVALLYVAYESHLDARRHGR